MDNTIKPIRPNTSPAYFLGRPSIAYLLRFRRPKPKR